MHLLPLFIFFFFFNDTATTEIYTLSLHDALPIYRGIAVDLGRELGRRLDVPVDLVAFETAGKLADAVKSGDRKSTRLNSSHGYISYAVFCLKKKKKKMIINKLQHNSTLVQAQRSD